MWVHFKRHCTIDNVFLKNFFSATLDFKTPFMLLYVHVVLCIWSTDPGWTYRTKRRAWAGCLSRSTERLFDLIWQRFDLHQVKPVHSGSWGFLASAHPCGIWYYPTFCLLGTDIHFDGCQVISHRKFNLCFSANKCFCEFSISILCLLFSWYLWPFLVDLQVSLICSGYLDLKMAHIISMPVMLVNFACDVLR